ncbi:MAG: phenylalanine--tRNA ligase subunit beta [Candidatus Taylorbacteria bacterium]|nr:phenylalanine--tRNA ligase subunit beta [Candidatus Taylorbacteria bacterium]
MLISYNWIRSYFEEEIPAPAELADIITMGAFEIDSIEEKDGDAIFDIKILPDRSSYALSHRYIAQEIGALIKKQIKLPRIQDVHADESEVVHISHEDTINCIRYVGRRVKNVHVDESPEWLRKQLEVLGQRSINSIVDLTNYVMLEAGQPLHAFDADKVEGCLRIRKARVGEKIVLLDGKELELADQMLVIADDVAALALAGIKGGKRAEVTKETKNLILEAACFNSTTTRKTSNIVGIKNDSSKRFENGVTPERAGLAMALLSAKIQELNPDAQFGEVNDIYPNPVGRRNISVSVVYIQDRLGMYVSKKEMIEILSRIDLAVAEDDVSDDILHISIPEYRPDIVIAEDIAEEVGRLYGYNNIVGVVPQADPQRRIQKNFYYHNLIRKTLKNIGFSEVYTYTLTEKGDVKLANPLTVERAYLRNNLSDLLGNKALFNLKNVDLLGLKDIRIFEIGKVYGGGVHTERFSLALTIARTKQPKGHDSKVELEAILAYIKDILGVSENISITWKDLVGDAQTPCSGFVAEIQLDEALEKLPVPTADLEMDDLPQIKFTPISPYPFSVRDVAVFVPGEKGQEEMVLAVIKSALHTIGKEELLVRSTLFDVFTKNKDGEPVKTSYAFRLVFQSCEKTLSEEEIVACMNAVTNALGEKGFEVR